MDTNINIDSSTAQDLAGKAILFEIGANAGILDVIEKNEFVTKDGLSKELNIDPIFVSDYLHVFKTLGLLATQDDTKSQAITYVKTPTYQREKNRIGYISWGMVSCAPLISNTQEFISNFNTAVRTHHRSGEHVARTSKWMGEKDFYPHAEKVILNLKPKKVIDLGSGTCGLLINIAKKLPVMHGVGVDISQEACEKAKEFIAQAALSDRIDVMVSPIQNLVEDNNVFVDADVIHAGFVFHDLLPDEEKTLDNLLRSIHIASPKAAIVIVDAIPFSQENHEAAFSSAFSFLHKFFMGRKFLSINQWQNKLLQAGFNQVDVEPLGISGGRIFVGKSIV